MNASLQDLVTSPDWFVSSILFLVLLSSRYLTRFSALRRAVFIVSSLSFLGLAVYQLVQSQSLLDVLLATVYIGAAFLAYIGLLEKYHAFYARYRLLLGGVNLLAIAQIFMLMLQFEQDSYPVTDQIVLVVAGIVFVFGLFMLAAAAYRSRFKLRSNTSLSDSSSAITLAIPARNETHALTQSLDMAVDTTYEKLEILVLDDCSADRTPEIIKGFARRGVRFIGGKIIPDNWLGKAFAYQQLYEQASGDMIVFSGVDVHIQPQALTVAMSYMQQHNLRMMSIAPQRLQNDFLSNALQSFRYFLQLALPRRFSALSSVWIIDKSALKELDGFDTTKDLLEPERMIARQVGAESYRFAISTGGLFTTRKRLTSQLETQQRLSYPAADSSVTVVVLGLLLVITLGYSLFELGLLVFVIVLPYFLAFALTNHLLLPGLNAIYTTIMLPVIALVQIYILLSSMIKYERGTIGWKDRNICIPVMSQKH